MTDAKVSLLFMTSVLAGLIEKVDDEWIVANDALRSPGPFPEYLATRLVKEGVGFLDAERAPRAGTDVTIGPIQHDNGLCQKTACTCWCQACERHNWRHERAPRAGDERNKCSCGHTDGQHYEACLECDRQGREHGWSDRDEA